MAQLVGASEIAASRMFAQNAGGVSWCPIKCCTTCSNSLGAYMPHPEDSLFQVWVRGDLFKEPLLNGLEAVQSPALVRLGWFDGACHRCQFRNCLVSKAAWGKLQTGFVGFSYNLDAEDRIPPNSKKLSWMPTCSTRRTSAQISAPFDGVFGATKPTTRI